MARDRVAVVDHLEVVEDLDAEVEVVGAGVVGRRAQGTRPEPGAGAVGDVAVPGGSDDRDVGLPGVELTGLGEQRSATEARRALERLRVQLGAQPRRQVALRCTHGVTVARGYASTVAESSVRLDSGLHAVIRPDRFVQGAYELVVDGTPQSHVNLDDPSDLFFEYIRRMGHVIDQLGMPGQPITALHLGAGALTIPRYVEATRPGSRQQVLELEPALVEFVRQELPLPRGASLRIRYGDARETLGRLPAGLRGAADLLVVDIFGGARIPAHVTSVEFYELAAQYLADSGVMLVNVADGAGGAFARGQVSTVTSVLADVAVLAEPQVLKGRRYGNFVIVGSRQPLPLEWMPRLMAGGPHPAAVVHGRDLRDWIAGAPVVHDDSAVPSPPPSRSVFQVRGGGG